MGNKNLEWQKEFSEFNAVASSQVPEVLSEQITAKVQADLHPSAFRVFTKTALVHTLVGGATLLACPQFGVSFTSSHGLMHYLMQYGENVCMLGCGIFFTAFSLLIASFVLKPEEVRALKSNQLLHLAFLSTYSLGIFLFLGGEVAFTLALVWSLGAILGGALSLEAGWAYRKSIFRKGLV